MAVKFTTMIKMDSETTWKGCTLQEIQKGITEQITEFYYMQVQVPKQEGLIENIKLVELMNKEFDDEPEVSEVREEEHMLVFDLLSPLSFAYQTIHDIYELKNDLEDRLTGILEQFKVQECTITLEMSTNDDRD